MKICRKCTSCFSGRYCVACDTMRKAKWRIKNPDKEIAYQAKYRAANPEAQAAKGVARRLANPLYNAMWRAANPSSGRIIQHNRRARQRANGGVLSKGLAEKLFKLQRGKCACCHVSLDDGSHLDHVIPVALGGPNEDWNMQLLCPPCNMQKHAKHPIDFMRSRGFLI